MSKTKKPQFKIVTAQGEDVPYITSYDKEQLEKLLEDFNKEGEQYRVEPV